MPQDKTFRGPLSELEPDRSKTAVESYFYPSNLTTVSNHYIRFDCNIFDGSRFQQGIKGDFSRPVDAGKVPIQDIGTALGGAFIMATPGGVGTKIGGKIIGTIPTKQGGTTTAALNYLNALPEGGSFYNSFPGLRGIGNKKTVSHLYLYTPDTITYDYKNNWETVSLREKFGMLADGISVINDMKNGNWGAAAITSAKGLSEAFGWGGIKSMVETTAQMMGTPFNPMTETLFKEVSPRGFQFNFKFMPQTQAETDQIYSIIEQFAFHAAPEYAQGEVGGFLIMPSTFDIKFMFLVRDNQGNPIEIENPWIRRISTCGLRSISVDYSPDGQWQAMEDGSPRALSLALEFVELELMTKDRIKRGF